MGIGGVSSSSSSTTATDDELLLYEKQKEEYLRGEQVDTISESSQTTNGLENQISNNQSLIGDQRDYLLQKLNFKYPFIATEILISTIGQYHILPLIMINNNLQSSNNNLNNSTSPLSSATSNNNNNNNNNQLKSNSNNDLTSNHSTSPRSTFKSNLNGEVIRRKLFSFIYQTKPLNSFQVKCFVRVIIAMMKIPHLTHLVMDYIYQENSLSSLTFTTSTTSISSSNGTSTSSNSSSNSSSNNSSTNGTSSGTSSSATATVNGSSGGSTAVGSTTTTMVASSHILQMLKHIDSSDEISELLLMCLLYEDEEIENSFSIIPSGNIIQDSFLQILNQTDESQIHKNNQVLKLKQMIIQQLCSLQCEQNYSRSVTFILTTIIQYRKPTTKKPPTIVQYILNRKQMELIIENTLKITSNSPSFVDNMNFIMNLILYISNNSQRLFILEDSISNIDWKMVLILVIEKIQVFVKLLNDESAREILKKDPTIIYVEQYHPLQSMLIDKKRGQLLSVDRAIECLNFNPLISFPPLGIYRLKIIELFVILFKHLESLDNIYSTNERSLSQIILNCDILEELIRLLFQYQSSLLHQMITRLLLDILEQNIEPFFEALFTKYNIVDKILKAHDLNQQLQREQRFSLAISGYLTVFGQIIGDKQLALLQENEKWLEFYQYASDRTFIEKVFRIGSVESHQSLPQGELQRLKDLEEFWANNNL
ncbi:predicted protein [Naegleria gruberi]|uniref:Predicted protein n=1 Tax=Naegleria gruberi TaxID=5762 RepID=D2V5C7_NAEGR|nr:uncharacterized protein NAEGRDRAFT_63775 [Naegleria gruberi]EFC48087.1 predicted protein [Naegleria gruberi]|eukprot:XP_002680831.1 predicted protein [Naegleria gruberi strain NEG-M]